MARNRWHGAWLRYPRTTQELRANQDRNDPYIRGRRRNLPTAYDDQFVHKQKSWKYLGRYNQYRTAEEKKNYNWHVYYYEWGDGYFFRRRHIMNELDRLGCYYEYFRGGIRWFGPSFDYE